MNGHTIDLDRLLKLRLVVARFGEMDNAKWWNSEGILGPHGKMLYARGFPKTHRFAQARAVFEVARARSKDIFDLAGTWTLWKLPAALEVGLDEHWPRWLDTAGDWEPFFEQVAALKGQTDALAALQAFGLVPDKTLASFKALRRDHDGRSVPLPAAEVVNDDVLTLLAAGFGRGEAGALAVPYVKAA
jgi:hypothetical protein